MLIFLVFPEVIMVACADYIAPKKWCSRKCGRWQNGLGSADWWGWRLLQKSWDLDFVVEMDLFWVRILVECSDQMARCLFEELELCWVRMRLEFLAKYHKITSTSPSRFEVLSTYRPFQIAYEGDFWCLFTVTFFGKKFTFELVTGIRTCDSIVNNWHDQSLSKIDDDLRFSKDSS